MSREVIVIGAGVAGLGAALALSRSGHRVTLLERDATPFPADPVEAFEKWDRRGATALRAFLRSLNLLDPPGDLLRDPGVLSRVLAVYQKRHECEEPKLGADHEEMVELLQRSA